ncbi:MAG TPA: IPT/TIG domain-containing protein, partial [Kofleriaceae bacterium]|nr:IPT/TIG domain-containing protein [Kofleriaceae bacterium]
AAGGTLSFGGGGGARPYRFEMAAAPSGGSIDADSGRYTAGPDAGVTDVVAVVDARGDRATAEVAVVAGLAVSPPAGSVTPRGEIDLTATGGVPPLAWELAGGSGGTLDVDGAIARYRAGATGDTTDTVTVSDAAGAARSVEIAVGPAPRVVPAAWSLAPSESRDFAVTGGTGPYAWDLVAAPSGGSIAPGTGLYTAGPTGGVTDTVRVRDGNGAAATAPVDVGVALALAPAAPAAGPGCPIAFTASGGQPPYAFTIPSAGSGSPSIDGAGGYLAGLTGPATDVVRVTDDAGAFADRSVAVGPRIAIAPEAVAIPALSSVDLTAASGGGEPYSFALVAGSVGSIEVLGPSAVRYHADGGSGTAGVRATDPCGRRATATITVTPSTSPPVLDYLWPRGAGAGVWLTVVGTGFDDGDPAANTVHFGAVEVPAARASASAVVVRVPDLVGSGTVAVTVSTASGEAAAPLDLAYYDGPAVLPLVVRSDHGGAFELYLGDTSGGGLAALTDDDGAANASGILSPDARRVVYVSDRDSVPQVGGYTDVYVVDLAGPVLPSSGHRNLSNTPTTSDGRPIWHPRGDLVYWWRNTPVVEIRRIDATAAGSSSEQVVGFTGGALSSLAITPDGRTLFFLRSDGGQRIYRLDLAGGGPAAPLNPASGVDEVTYAVSADGRSVYFARGYGAGRRLFRQAASADGSVDPVEITITGAPTLADFDTSWDGADLALQPESLLEDGIWLVGVGGGAAAEVLAGAPVDRVFYLADDVRLVDQILSGGRYRLAIVPRSFAAPPVTLYDLGGATGQTLASEGQVAAPP